MNHLTRSGFDSVITNVFAMNETACGQRQKYGNHTETVNPPRVRRGTRAYCVLPGFRTTAIGMRPTVVAKTSLGTGSDKHVRCGPARS